MQNPIVEDDFNGFCIVTMKELNSYGEMQEEEQK